VGPEGRDKPRPRDWHIRLRILRDKETALNLPKLMASPKARKRGDIERILHSEDSEDYVTWNFFQLLESAPASCWWPALLRLSGMNEIDPADTPTVRLWQTVPAPRAYEALSRERMRTSDNAAWRERSLDMNPVEGPSEIDITFEGRSYIIYVEAKLGSDVSLSTTYDPERNQIVRVSKPRLTESFAAVHRRNQYGYSGWFGIVRSVTSSPAAKDTAAAASGLLTPAYHLSGKSPRYYQEIAINRANEAILLGERRVLLTMARGTGKTVVAFQICWKMWNSRWNRKPEQEHRRPRILYLADRNILIDDPRTGSSRPSVTPARKLKTALPTTGDVFQLRLHRGHIRANALILRRESA